MGSLSRSQLLVYGAVAVVLLLVGARWIRSGDNAQGLRRRREYADILQRSRLGRGSLAVDAAGGERRRRGRRRARSPSPGVYRLPAGTRVNDAVQRAGGATARAEIDAINLAARLTRRPADRRSRQGQGPCGVAAGPAIAGGATATDSRPRSAWAPRRVDELDTIEGIGPVTAQNIVEFRDQHGGISSVDQLDQIDGIGPATMDALRSRLQP